MKEHTEINNNQFNGFTRYPFWGRLVKLLNKDHSAGTLIKQQHVDPTILVETLLGTGQALFLIDYGMHIKIHAGSLHLLKTESSNILIATM